MRFLVLALLFLVTGCSEFPLPSWARSDDTSTSKYVGTNGGTNVAAPADDLGSCQEQANAIILSAIGGDVVTTTVEGRERYGVNVRYARDFRDDVPALRRVLVPTASGAQIPLAQIADIRKSTATTVRQQAQAIYRKSNLEGRSELAAYFLDAILHAPEIGAAPAEAALTK